MRNRQRRCWRGPRPPSCLTVETCCPGYRGEGRSMTKSRCAITSHVRRFVFAGGMGENERFGERGRTTTHSYKSRSSDCRCYRQVKWKPISCAKGWVAGGRDRLADWREVGEFSDQQISTEHQQSTSLPPPIRMRIHIRNLSPVVVVVSYLKS